MASGRPSTVPSRTFHTPVPRNIPPRTASGTNNSLHSHDLCALKINLLMQEYHDLQTLPHYSETVAGEKEALQRAIEAMTFKNKVLNGQILCLTAELAAIKRGRMDPGEIPFSLLFRTSTLKLREYARLVWQSRRLGELVVGSSGGSGFGRTRGRGC